MPERRVPVRQCMGCREHKPKGELCRVVRTKEGGVSLDTTGRKPGRGVYICLNAACFARVKKTRALDRALSVKVPEEVYEQIQMIVEGEKP